MPSCNVSFLPASNSSIAVPVAEIWRPQQRMPFPALKPGTPNIQSSTCASVRSWGVRSGFRKAARLPSRSARASQAAMRRADRACGFRGRSRGATAPDRPRRWRNGRRDVPAVERPEMHVRTEPFADEPQPRHAGMGGFRYRALHIEMKHGLGATGAFLRQSPPARIARARRAVAHDNLPYKIDMVYLHRSASTAGSRRGRQASRALGRAPRNSSAGPRSRGRCQPRIAASSASRSTSHSAFRRWNFDRRCIAFGEIDT